MLCEMSSLDPKPSTSTESSKQSSVSGFKRKRLLLFLKKKQFAGASRSSDEEPCTKRRFAKVSEEDLESCKKKPVSKNTQRAYQWAFNVFCEWIKLPSVTGNYKEEDLWRSTDVAKVVTC